MDLLQAEIERLESDIYDCEGILEGKGTELTEVQKEEASQRKPGLEQEREANVLKRAAILEKLFNAALDVVIPFCNSDKELRQHLQD